MRNSRGIDVTAFTLSLLLLFPPPVPSIHAQAGEEESGKAQIALMSSIEDMLRAFRLLRDRAGERWVMTGFNEENSGGYRLDSFDPGSAAMTSPHIYKVWMRSDYSIAVSRGGKRCDTIKELGEIDCAGRRTRYINFVAYLNGEVVYSRNSSEALTWRDWVPGTVGEAQYTKVCRAVRARLTDTE
jgi:hypothetical protein